jgi:protein SCO1/2
LVAEDGQAVMTGDLLRGKPVVLAFVYFDCPSLCSLLLKDLVGALTATPDTVGRDFDVWVVSIDPRDDAALAAARKQSLLAAYGRRAAGSGWHVLTGRADQVGRLAGAAGIRYAYDRESGEYRHPSAVITVTPQGRISRYLLGLGFQARDVRLALAESGAEHVEAPTARALNRLLLYCYHYDAITGRYGLAAVSIVRAGAAIGAGLLLWLVAALWRSSSSEMLREDPS